MERPAGRLALAVVMNAERILVASDGGAASAAALRWVIDRLGDRGAQVEIVDVVDPTAPDAAERRASVRGMARLLELVAPSVPVRLTDAPEDPAELLTRSRDDLLVVGAHRRNRGRTPFAELAALDAQGPVVVIPSEWICRRGPVMVGVGAEDEMTATLAFAEREAGARRTDVRLIHAWETTGAGEIPPAWDFGTESIPERQGRALARLAELERTSHPGLTVTAEAVQGRVVARLSQAARTASLLVVGRSHRNAVVRSLFGSAASGLLVALPCPVAVVP
ncbi:MAG TPA: universal stress protein [Pseudolysinimonas sp.]|nr:universal stress protein [Pseudolysinimonas sp.]